MNQKIFMLIMMFFTLILAGCQEKRSSKKSSSRNALACSGTSFYTTPGCGGYCALSANANLPICLNGGATTGGTTGSTTGSTIGGTIGGTTGSTNCTSPIAKTCTNYCTTYPNSLGCLPGNVNCWRTPSAAGCPGSSTNLYPFWGTHYPGGEPTGYCSPTRSSGAGSNLETRKATITGTGGIGYNPIGAANFMNTSPMLKSVVQSKIFFLTDSVLKVRVKVKPQQELTGDNAPTFCYNRRRNGPRIAGYTKLKLKMNVWAVNISNNPLFLRAIDIPETGVNACSSAIDLTQIKEDIPEGYDGIVVSFENIQSNQNCTSYNNFTYCGAFSAPRTFDCWGLDLEVAADGTKTFD